MEAEHHGGRRCEDMRASDRSHVGMNRWTMESDTAGRRDRPIGPAHEVGPRAGRSCHDRGAFFLRTDKEGGSRHGAPGRLQELLRNTDRQAIFDCIAGAHRRGGGNTDLGPRVGLLAHGRRRCRPDHTPIAEQAFVTVPHRNPACPPGYDGSEHAGCDGASGPEMVIRLAYRVERVMIRVVSAPSRREGVVMGVATSIVVSLLVPFCGSRPRCTQRRCTLLRSTSTPSV